MPVNVTMPDAEIAELAHELAVRKGVSEIEAVRFALRLALREEEEPAAFVKRPSKVEVAARPAQRRNRAINHLPHRSEALGPSEREDAAMARVRTIVAHAAATRRDDNRSEDDILGYPEMFPNLYGRE